MNEFWYNKLPEAVARARSAVHPEGIAGYLMCALERRGRVTGLLFCDQSNCLRDGSPIQTGLIEDRAWVEEYELVIAADGVYVIAHRQHENGASEMINTH
jgi:hypothetical protein